MLEKYFFPSCNWCHQNCIRLLCFKINHVVPQIGHDVDHFTSPEGVPGVPETNFNNRPNSFKVLSPPRTCVVMFTYQLLLNWTDELEAIHHSAIPATDKTFATRLTTVWMKRLRQLVLERLLQKSLMSMQPPLKTPTATTEAHEERESTEDVSSKKGRKFGRQSSDKSTKWRHKSMIRTGLAAGALIIVLLYWTSCWCPCNCPGL